MAEQGATDSENDTAEQRRHKAGIGGKPQCLLAVSRNVKQNIERAVRDDGGADAENQWQRMLVKQFTDRHLLWRLGFKELRRFSQPHGCRARPAQPAYR